MFRGLVAILIFVTSVSVSAAQTARVPQDRAIVPAGARDEPLLDFWDEELRLFGVAAAGQSIAHDLAARRDTNFRTQVIALDHADHRVGDLSLVYSPRQAGMPERFGFVSSLWGGVWELSDGASLKFWARVEDRRVDTEWAVQFVDRTGLLARGSVRGISGRWTEFTVDTADLIATDGFDWGAVEAVEFQADLSNRASVHLDGVRFESPAGVTGVTDKALSQRMAEAADTRDIRIADAFLRQASIAESDFPPPTGGRRSPQKLTTAFAMMMVNQDLETANRYLREELAESSVLTSWSLYEAPFLARFYLMFSAEQGRYPGRLTAETEALLLDTLWQRNEVKNDISLTRQSTWWLAGSENHDLQAKAVSLAASAIFMREPAYRERVYPNLGYGGGYYYGHAGYYGPEVDFAARSGGGRAENSDGAAYTPSDHYAAWVDFFQAYIVERGRRGFFLEHASLTYAKHSLGFLQIAGTATNDPALAELWDEFYTVYWADWAQTSISGVRGGPKTRHHGNLGGPSDTQTADLISFHLGGPANAGPYHYWNLLDDYELPAIVWRMALDRNAMGEFTVLSRGIGEEENQWPRPAGNERSLTVDTRSRFLRSTLVTPDYTLGTQMDHPGAVHSHLSIAGRWHGMTFAQSPEARIVVVGLPDQPDATGRPPPEWDMEMMLHTVHEGRTLVLQQARRWFAVSPEWFPADAGRYERPMGIWFGEAWDRRIERDGWVFVQSGNAYAAVRPVVWDADYERPLLSTGVGSQINFNKPFDSPTVRLLQDSYSWNEEGTIMQLRDRFAPVIIEASDTAHQPSLEAFIDEVLDNRLELHKTVVPGYHIMVYVGAGGEAREIVFNTGAPEIPTRGGQRVDYSRPMTWDSPFLSSEYLSGVVTLRFGDDQMIIDFTD